MTILWNGLGLAFCGLAAVLVLRETRKEFVPYILLTVCILTFLSILPFLRETMEWLRVIGTGQQYTQILLKALGISLLTEMGCEISKSAGEAGIAGYAALIGKVELFAITIPLFRQLVEMAVGYPG